MIFLTEMSKKCSLLGVSLSILLRTVTVPLLESIANLSCLFPFTKLYSISPFLPLSLSVAVKVVTTLPTALDSSIVTEMVDFENTGALSFKSYDKEKRLYDAKDQLL